MRAPEGARHFVDCKFKFSGPITAITTNYELVALVNGREVARAPAWQCKTSVGGVLHFDVKAPIQAGDDCTARLELLPGTPEIVAGAPGLTIEAAMTISGTLEVEEGRKVPA